MEKILLAPNDPRRPALQSRVNKLEGQIDVIALSSRQMHIICPLEILRALIRNGKVDFFELRNDLVSKYDYSRKNFSEARYTEAFMRIAGEIGVADISQASPAAAVA